MTMPPVHPAAELFPLVGEDELRELANDIQEHDLHERIVLTPDGQLLDGRNRWRACETLGLDPSDLTRVETSEPWAYVISANLHRRHLSPAQRAMIGNDYATRRQGGSDKIVLNPHMTGSEHPAPTQDQVAALLDIHPRSVQTARRVIRDAPAAADLVRAGAISMRAATRIAALSPAAQEEALIRLEAGEPVLDVVPPNAPQPIRERPERAPTALVHRSGRHHDRVYYITIDMITAVIGHLDALKIGMERATRGLDPAITPDEAAAFLNDLTRVNQDSARFGHRALRRHLTLRSKEQS